MALGFQQGHPIIREEAHNIERNDERTVRDIMNGAEKTPRPTIAGESTMNHEVSCGNDHQTNQNWRLWFEDGMCCEWSVDVGVVDGCGGGCVDVVPDVVRMWC